MYIGIDLGTSAIKLALTTIIDGNVTLINEFERMHNLIIPKDNWSEQDPDVWFDLVMEGLVSLTKDHKEIKGISFSGQMHGLVLLDENDKVLRNAILWNDQRTEKQTEELKNIIGEEVIYQETNNMMLTGFTAPKLLWVKQNEPKIFSKIKKIMLPKDYLIYKLTGIHATEVTDISGSLFYDVKNNKYSKKILDYLEISASQLPKVYNSTDVVGKMLPKTAEFLKLNCSPSIIAGGADNAVGAVLTNTFKEGDCSISIGTSGVILTPIDNIDKMKNNSLHCFRHVNNKFYLMGVTLSAASSIQWFKEQFAKEKNYDELYESIETTLKTKTIFLPYLSGERTPINNPNAKGVLMNLSKDTKQADMFKAVLEGVSFSLKSVLNEMLKQGLKLSKAVIIGGGTRNQKFTQIIADVLGIELYTVNKQMGAALGAAMIAMVGNKEFLDIENVNTKMKTVNIIKPNNEMKSYYDTKFENYNQLYESVKHLF